MGEGTIRLRVPSRSRPGLLHEVLIYRDTGDTWCSCEDVAFGGPPKRGEEACWHGREALELAGLAPAPAVPAVERRPDLRVGEVDASVLELGNVEGELALISAAGAAGYAELERRSREVELAHLFHGTAPLDVVDRMALLRADLADPQRAQASAAELEELVVAGGRRRRAA